MTVEMPCGTEGDVDRQGIPSASLRIGSSTPHLLHSVKQMLRSG